MTIYRLFDGPRAPGREHIPVYPLAYRIVRIAVLPITVVVLGLDAYGLSWLSFSGDALMMFTAVASIVTSIYFFVAYFGVPALFNYWALLGLDIFNVVFWLISFALLASQVAPLMGSGAECYYGYCYSYGLYGSDLVVAQCLLAAAGVGALVFVLYAVLVTLDGLALFHHRSQGFHCQAVSESDVQAVQAVPMQSVPVQSVQSVPVQPQNVYQSGQTVYPTN